MNSRELQQLWSRFNERKSAPADSEASLELNPDELRALGKAMMDFPTLMRELADDRAIDSMLRATAQLPSEGDKFLEDCIRRLRQEQTSTQVTDPGSPHPVVVNTEKPGVTSRRRERRMAPTMLTACITIAILFLMLGGIWLFQMPSSEQPDNLQASNSVDNARHEPNSAKIQINDSLAEAATALDQRVAQNDDESSSLPDQKALPGNGFDIDTELGPPKRDDVAATTDATDRKVDLDVDPPAAPQALQFVKIESAPDCRWESGPTGNQLQSSRLALSAGRARLTFDNGSQIELVGPSEIEIQSPEAVYVHQGHILANLPSNIEQFSVQTPSSRLDDSGSARFQLKVDRQGSSEVLLEKGQAELNCWNSRSQVDQMLLDSAGMNQALVQNPDINTLSPAICMARGNDGQFQGLVNINGQSLMSEDADTFARLAEGAAQGWSNAPNDFVQQWNQLIQQMRQSMNGSINIDGNLQPFRSFEDLMRMSQGMSNRFPGGQSNFQGSININGKEYRFDSWEEFQKAQMGMLGPLLPNTDPVPNGNRAQRSNHPAFDGEINVNGRSIRFTSPEAFRKALGSRW